MKKIHKKVVNTTTRNSIAQNLTTSCLFLIAFLFSSNLLAQDQFLWTGAGGDNKWENRNNWDYYPYGTNIKTSPAPFYPGSSGGTNANGGKDDIAIFTNFSNLPCTITTPCTGTGSALRIGGIHVEGYGGIITQSNGNRFNIAESNDLGGNGFWDGTTPIASGHPDLTALNADIAYQAYFNFTSGGGFIGGGNIVGGISPSYALLFAVPLTVEANSGFMPPEDEMRIRHNASLLNGAFFNNGHHGTVVLSNRTNGAGSRQYSFANIHFWNLKVTPNGASPRIKEFIGGTCIVDNDFLTTGLLGAFTLGAEPIIMNATSGVEVHVKNNIIIRNTADMATLTAANAAGNLVIVMNGNTNQFIDHSHNDIDFQGNLPYLKIDKPAGQVTLKGPVTINGNIEFVSGHVKPATPSTQTALTKDVFVLNSNATVSGMSDTSFCTGAIRVRTGKTIELPIGKGATYRPAIVRAVSGVSPDNSILNMYRAEYFEAIPAESPSIIDTDVLTQVSNCEVWAIQKEAATTPDPWTFNLELSYNPSTAPNCTHFLYPSPNSCLAVSRWNHAVKWVSHGNAGAFVASNGDQTVRTDSSITYSDFQRSNTEDRPDLFTFGESEAAYCATSSCTTNVCVEYCFVGGVFKFDPTITYSTGSTFAGISWNFGDSITSTNMNPTHAFTTTGVHSIDVTVYAVNGGDTCSTSYTFSVFNNNCTLPVVESIQQPIPQKEPQEEKTVDKSAFLLITPNPSSNGMIQFLLKTDQVEQSDYVITNKLGQTILKGQLVSNEYTSIKTTPFPVGTYWITVQLGEEITSQQFVISR